MSEPVWLFQGPAECGRCKSMQGEHYTRPAIPHRYCKCRITKKCSPTPSFRWEISDTRQIYDALCVSYEVYADCCDDMDEVYVGGEEICFSRPWFEQHGTYYPDLDYMFDFIEGAMFGRLDIGGFVCPDCDCELLLV